MRAGDVAGLALLNLPYAWIGVRRQADGLSLEQFDQTTGITASAPPGSTRVWLRAQCDFLAEQATFSYSTDGATFQPLGGTFAMIFQLKTFQGVRYALFHYNTGGVRGGHADFAQFTVDEPHPHGLRQPIPIGEIITLATFGGGWVLAVSDDRLLAVPAGDPLAQTAAAQFRVIDCGLGRIALQSAGGFVSVIAPGAGGQVIVSADVPTAAATFHWTETPYGDLVLLALATHRHLRMDPRTGTVSADWAGPLPDRSDGACLIWKAAV
jgi:xylan 1,4-beta-xylosidase